MHGGVATSSYSATRSRSRWKRSGTIGLLQDKSPLHYASSVATRESSRSVLLGKQLELGPGVGVGSDAMPRAVQHGILDAVAYMSVSRSASDVHMRSTPIAEIRFATTTSSYIRTLCFGVIAWFRHRRDLTS